MDVFKIHEIAALYTNFDRNLCAMHAIATRLNWCENRMRRLKIGFKQKKVYKSGFNWNFFSSDFNFDFCFKIFTQSKFFTEIKRYKIRVHRVKQVFGVFAVHISLLCWWLYFFCAACKYCGRFIFFILEKERERNKLKKHWNKKIGRGREVRIWTLSIQFLLCKWNFSICTLFSFVWFHVYWLFEAAKDDRQYDSPIFSFSLPFRLSDILIFVAPNSGTISGNLFVQFVS